VGVGLSPLHGACGRRVSLADRRAKASSQSPHARGRVHGQSERRNAGVEAVEAPKGDAGRAIEARSRPVLRQPGPGRPHKPQAGAPGTSVHGDCPWGSSWPSDSGDCTRPSTRMSLPSGWESPSPSGWYMAWLTFRLLQFPAVRRVLDRDGSGDEQGLVDQPRRTLYRATTVVLSTVVLWRSSSSVWIPVVDICCRSSGSSSSGGRRVRLDRRLS
jgi:hypothetical protein